MAGDIRKRLTAEDAKAVFGNRENGSRFLAEIGAGVRRSSPVNEVWNGIAAHWCYEEHREVVRGMFRKTPKYESGVEAEELLAALSKEWRNLDLGAVRWPCSQARFDALVQSINNGVGGRESKDDQVKQAAVRFRRMKELVTARNDLIERLLFDSQEDIIPTFSHRTGVDFFIHGERFDQKVSKSVGAEFRQQFGDGWRAEAIESPEKLAKSLYENQDSDRFGDEPRLLVVDVDEAAFEAAAIRGAVSRAAVGDPMTVPFRYTHPGGSPKQYTTKCIVVLLTAERQD